MDPASKQAAKYKTQSLLGIINDKVEVGMAKIRGEDSAALDVAIIKATLQDEVVPKEKHVRTLKAACNGSSPRQTVNYVIHGLARRLEDNAKAWLVTLKTLIVFHRLMRETDPSFQEELLRYAERTGHHRMLRLESFADHTTKETWDLSAFIRVYSLYLDERLAVFRAMRFDPQHDQGLEARESKLKNCTAAELLDQLPAVQRLLGRLVSCVPEGASQSNEIALLACSLVLQEVRSVYKVVCEGVLNLVDKFFEMDRGDMLKGVELVKENLAVNERLNAFVATIGGIPALRGAVQFPAVQPLPADFLTTLEEYVKDTPKTVGDKAGAGRAAPTAVRGPTPRLIVGGPIKDAASGPTSPQPAPVAPAPAPEVDLLGGFEALTVNPTLPPAAAAAAPPAAPASAMPPAPPAAAPPPASFDPFASFGGAPAPAPAAAAAPPAVPAVPPPAAAVPPAYPYGPSSSFAHPGAAPAGGPFGYQGVPPPVSPQPVAPPPVANTFNDAMFGGSNAFGAPPPAYPAAPPQPAPAASGPTPFNPFANPSMHAAVAPHMPTGSTPPVPAPAATPFPPPPTPATPPPPASAQVPAPAVPQPQAAPPAGFAPSPQPQLQGVGAFANPFSSPGVASPAAAPANPFSSPGSANASPAQGANPFGGAAATTTQPPPAGTNPFAAAAPGAGAWPGAAVSPAVTTQQVGGYNLKKPADPLHDLSFDLFGKPQAPAAPQPMRAQAGPTAGPNGAGSPGNFF
ncbi:hypothetical protein Agub_g9325 [Astrephomene gubernaculifera]|uniref:ENTH domain-containing protein n=1 Tax=Astrephomene gubernaculifera TaxID=47775 RepID=A0AAD3DT85_9CHLO|nr:hypothetical protein Agub_g9325 [Astrephomene gubernaculifera]